MTDFGGDSSTATTPVTDTKLGVKLSEFEMWRGYKVGVVKRQGNSFGGYFAQNLLEWKAQSLRRDSLGEGGLPGCRRRHWAPAGAWF